MVQLILKYRVQVLVLLIVLEIFLTIGVYFEESSSARMYFMLESATSFLILIISITFLDKLNLYLFLTSKHEYLHNVAPCSYIFFDTKKNKVLVPEYTCRMLGIKPKKNFQLIDVEQIFTPQDWREIEKFVSNPISIHNHEKIGNLRYENTHGEIKHFKYSLQYIEDKKYLIHGIIFWFTDFSDSVEHEESIISLIKKYRLLSFELDFLFNYLPFPIWRREHDGKIVFSNSKFKKFVKRFDTDQSADEFENGLTRLAEISMKDMKPSKISKSYVSKNKNITYEFTEMPISASTGTVGFGIDISRADEFEKELLIVGNTLDRILELSSSAIMILDKRLSVFQFNQTLITMLDIDSAWLATKPTYSAFWDKLRESNKLPEFQNYKEFKDKQITLLSQLTEPKSDFMHLPNGQSIRFSVIPSGKNTIVMFDNITDVLNVERSYNELMSVYKAIIHQLKNSVIIFGQDGKLKLYNPSFAHFSKLNEEFLSTLPHVSEVLNHANSNFKTDSISELKNKIINCMESRKNSVVHIQDVSGNTFETQVSSLPDNGVLVTING